MTNDYGLMLKKELLDARDALNSAIEQIDDEGCVNGSHDIFRLRIASAARYASQVLYNSLPDPEEEELYDLLPSRRRKNERDKKHNKEIPH